MNANRRLAKFGCCVGNAFLILLGLTFSPLMLYLGISSIYDELELNNGGVVTNAAVVDTQVWQDSGTERYEVQYQFTVADNSTVYSYSDRFGRPNLWGVVTKDQWEDLQSTHQVEVRYLPRNPWVNRLVHSDPASPIPDLLAAVCIGIAPWFILLVVKIYGKKTDNST